MNYYDKVNNGMSPKDAYLDVLQNDFDFDGIPALNALPVLQALYINLTIIKNYQKIKLLYKSK